jgi:hypothetical protein
MRLTWPNVELSRNRARLGLDEPEQQRVSLRHRKYKGQRLSGPAIR